MSDVEQSARRVEGHRQARAARSGQPRRLDLVGARVDAAREDRAPQVGAAGHAVDPGDRVAVALVALGHRGHHRVEVGVALGVDQDPVGLDGDQAQGEPGDDAGQAHPADGRPEEVGVGVGPDGHRAGRGDQSQAGHVRSERPVDVVVLAVHVGGDGPAEGDAPGPGRDRDEPALGHAQGEEVVVGVAGADLDQSVGADLGDPPEAGVVDDDAARDLGRVAVAAPQAARDDRAAGEGLGDLVLARRGDDRGRARRGPPPAGEARAVHQ